MKFRLKKREGRIDSDSFPVQVSNSAGDESGQPDETQANKNPKTNKKETTIERGNSLNSEIPEWLQEFGENLVDDEIPLQGGSHASSSQSRLPRDVRIWVNIMFILISLKTEIARSVKGPKLQGPHAEDAMAKPHFVLTNLVT